MDPADSGRKADVERIPMSEARDRLTELMNRAFYKDEQFILTKNGEDVAAIVAANRVGVAA